MSDSKDETFAGMRDDLRAANARLKADITKLREVIESHKEGATHEAAEADRQRGINTKLSEKCDKWKGLYYELANVAIRTDNKLTKLTIAAQAVVENPRIQDAVDELVEALEGVG